jgi:hypothetical protein
MLPMLTVQAPVSLVSAVVTATLYMTAFRDEPIRNASDMLSDGPSGPLFAFLVMTAFEGLFAQVARGATVVSLVAVASGRPKSVTESLDPAFTRLGGLLVLALIPPIAVVFGVITVVGLVILPYLVLRIGVAFEAYIVEEIGPWAALGRSWRLTSRSVLRLLAVLILTFMTIVLPLLIISSLGVVVQGGRTSQIATTALVTFVQGILAVPVLAFATATTALFYLKLRARLNA